ncbi:capsular exopolysaccharide synthesis family protein [Microbacterium trichothecenolyticum]|uniref:polysaccharide biosynthesis tyrosine autokinase n=1 Tax=Microbacterium trichothecenolyticum TaxID=69370 RepID=UPI00285A865F|nr:polysaccharide biosynthesis tyrosine autokinase [Microbacterium trichothecenolyticum]MDR7184919.1 capsular exopolysaccharide synthesis family protein [Microbacterium trichothecenolyticum]
MELTDYIRILRKNWVIIVVATLVGIGVAAAWSLTRTPQYEAQSTVFVSTQSGSTIQDLQQGSNFTQSRVQTYTNLVTTPIVMNPVIAELGLGMTASELSAEVEASAALNTTLITITVTGADPVQAADVANALGASLKSVVERLETPNGTDTSPVRVERVKDALPPLSPSSPNVPLNLALGALVGLAIGIGVAVLRAVLDTRIRTPRDVEQVTDRPLIGAIAFDPKAKERPLIVHADPLSPRAESFRAMRTNLQFLETDEGRASYVITSSVPSEGKSTTTINLAIALADAGKRVALLDTDLRKPKIAEYLGIEGGAGLTDVLIGRARLADVMLPWGNRSLYVLPAGKIPPNPSELLGSKSMLQLLEALERDVDIVLCDAPPLLPVTDAAILAKATSGAILVVSAGHTNRHQLSGAVDALNTAGAHIAGVAMTMVPTRGPDSYAYGYGYGTYGYGYVQEKPAKAKAPKKTKAEKAAPAPAPTRPAASPARQAAAPAAARETTRPAKAGAPAASPFAPVDTARSIPTPADEAGPEAGLTIDDIIRQAGGASTAPGRNDPLP